MTTSFTTEYGNPQLFGDADYSAALYPHRTDTEALQTTRNRVLDWLTANEHLLWTGDETSPGGNRPGVSGGLYDRIQNPTLNTQWGQANDPLRKVYFGHSDLDATRAGGFTDLQIKNYLDQAHPERNRDDYGVLKDANVPVSLGGETWGVYNLLNIPTGEDTPDTPSSGGAADTRPDEIDAWPHIHYNTDEYTPPDTDRPTMTRNPISWNERADKDITRGPGNNLKINPTSYTAKSTIGINKPKRRAKYRQTTDLARQARNSLNIL